MNKERSRDHDRLQYECVRWFSETYPAERGMFFHVKNNSVGMVRASMDKALGTERGVSDTILIGKGFILCIEFKVGRDKQSDRQVRFEKMVLERGHRYEIISSLEQFKILIHGTLGDPKFRPHQDA